MTHPLARLLTAWNEPEHAARAAILDDVLADDFVYADPHQPAPITTRDGFLDFLEIFRTNVSGAVVLLTGDIQAHHGFALGRFEIQRDGAPFAHMLYVSEDENGRLSRILGFMDDT